MNSQERTIVLFIVAAVLALNAAMFRLNDWLTMISVHEEMCFTAHPAVVVAGAQTGWRASHRHSRGTCVPEGDTG